MESEGQEDESLEKSNQIGLRSEPVPKPFKQNHSSGTKISIPAHRPSRQLWLHAALMCGRDFLYAMEVVLFTPIMLQLGMEEHLYSYIWFCSPTMGLLLGPLMGNWSDRCTLKWGRRRPFILGFVVGTVVAMTLMIFSRDLAMFLSDSPADQRILGIVFGIIATQVMDFCLDQLETPLRAFTLDVCSPSDQQRAFALQTLFMGLGAALGFIVDGIKWEEIFGFKMIGLQIKVVYVFAIVIWVTTAGLTLFSIKEVQWKKPTSRKRKLSKSSTSLKVSSEMRKLPTCKARETASDSCVLSRKNGIIKRAINDDIVSVSENDPNHKLIPSTGEGIPTVLVTSDLNKDGEPCLLDNEGATDEHKRLESLDVEDDDADFLYPSPAFRSITLLPRISLCKSIFMTMSCPEGLNDTAAMSSVATTLSLATDDDSSDNEDDSANLHQDEDPLGSSMPNLSSRDSGSRHPATFLEIIKNKIQIFSSSNPDIIPSQGSTVDPENRAILTQNNALKDVFYGENTQKNDSISESSCHIKENCTKNENHTVSNKSENFDERLNMGAVRQLTFDPEKEVKEALLEKKNGKGERKRRKKKKASVEEDDVKPVSTRLLWLSILTMPMKLRWLCFSLLTSFTGLEVLLLWYTNIFGSVVYGGDPKAPANSTELQLYNDGVHMGCWGLTIYAVAVMIFSVMMEHFSILSKMSLRVLYGGGQLVTAISTTIMFIFPEKYVILLLSWTIGITVSMTVTVPYVLVGKYHQDKEYVMRSPGATRRGYGTDCAILACQMYAGNLLYAAISGPIIAVYGGVKIMLIVASLCHAVSFIACVLCVTYPGERNFKFRGKKHRTNVAEATNDTI